MAEYLGSKIFDKGAEENYDNLRFMPKEALAYCAELIFSLSPNTGSNFLDAGCGNGRFYLPLLDHILRTKENYQIIGIDNSQDMLDSLQSKLNPRSTDKVSTILKLADLQKPLPVEQQSVNVVFTIATFHIFNDWQAAVKNLSDVIVKNGYFVTIAEYNQFMHQTEGFERDYDFLYLDKSLSQFMREYHRLRKEFNNPYNPSQVRYSDMSALYKFIVDKLNFEEIEMSIDDKLLSWQKPHSFADIIHCLRHRQMTTWGSDMDDEIRIPIVEKLEEWLKVNKIDVNQTFYLPARLKPRIFQKKE